MAIAMRLSRGGSKKRPYYRVIVANSRSPRDGKYLEQVGTYNPLLAKDDAARVRLVEDRVRYWLGVGAQPTDRVARMLDKAGIRERAATSNPHKGEPGQKAKDRAEEKAAKLAEAEEAKRAAAAAPAPEVEEAAPAAPAAEEAPAAPAAASEAEPAEQPAVEQSAEQPAAEQPAAEQPAAEQASAGEAAPAAQAEG